MLIAHLPASIEDGDLRLRHLRISDGPLISNLLQHEDILISSGVCKSTRKASWVFFYWWLRRTFLVAYAIQQDARMIGFIGLHKRPLDESLEISLVIFDPKSRRRGFGTRSLEMLSGALSTIKLADNQIARVGTNNKSALSFWTKLGFKTAQTDGDVTVMIRNKRSVG